MSKQFWWGVLVGAILGAVIFADQSEFASGLREMVSHGRNAVSALLSVASESSRGIAEGVAD